MPAASRRSTTGAASGFLRGSGEKVISVPCAGVAGDLPELVGDQRVARDEQGVHALLAHLAQIRPASVW
jgi:hypothetical protein